MIVQRASNLLKRLLAPRDGPIILMYHRVGAPPCDPAQLAVTADNLAQQIEALKARRTIVPLGWLAERRARGLPVDGTAVITFDDGYADVLHNGLPVLARLDCPATIFLATGTIGTVTNMWWDVLARLLLASETLPAEIEVALPGRRHRIAIEQGSARSRARAYGWISEAVRPLVSAARDAVVEDLARQIRGGREDISSDRLMTPEEILQWHRKGMFDIGAHTVSHASLTALPAAAQHAEIAESCRACAALTGEAPTSFAYPYGHHDSRAVHAAASAGISAAVTTEKRKVRASEHPLTLPRYYVGNWQTDDFAMRLSL